MFYSESSNVNKGSISAVSLRIRESKFAEGKNKGGRRDYIAVRQRGQYFGELYRNT